MPTAEKTGIVRHAGEGTRLVPLGGEILFKAVTSETGGAWSMIEVTVPPFQTGAPPHYHKIMTEAFYVLEGSPTFQLDGEAVAAGPRSFILVPPGTVHGFSNDQPQPARVLILASPAGHERFFEQLDGLIRAEGQWPPQDVRKLLELGQNNDVYYQVPHRTTPSA